MSPQLLQKCASCREIAMSIVAALLVAVAACAADKPNSVAIVEDTKSAITITRAGGQAERKDRKDLIYVWEKDRITISADGEVILVFFAGTKQQLTAGTYEITSQGCQPVGGTPPPAKPTPLKGFSAAKQQGWSGISKGSGRGAGLVLRSALSRTPSDITPPAVAPIREELVASDRPDFRWQGGRPPFKVQLFSATNRLIWTAQSEKAELAFPQTEAALKRNRTYRWEIWSLAKPEAPEVVAESTFGVASEDTARTLDELQSLKSSDSSFELLLAISSFQAYGAESEALAACEKLLKQLPQDPDVLRLAADLYDRAGRTKEGEAAYKSALNLGLDIGKQE